MYLPNRKRIEYDLAPRQVAAKLANYISFYTIFFYSWFSAIASIIEQHSTLAYLVVISALWFVVRVRGFLIWLD